jgi:hypothetical protein
MKITNNPIGNYTPNYASRVTPQNEVKEAKRISIENSITEKEKEFFIKKYPNDAKEIVDYHFYKKEGMMSGVTIGTLFDRRG